MKTNYKAIKYIFTQRALSSSYMEQILKSKMSNLGWLGLGELDYWFWRYVFMKDVTKKALTNQLLKVGFDNLTVVEIIDALNSTRKLVKEILKDAKEKVK